MASELGFRATDAELESYARVMDADLAAYAQLDRLADFVPAPGYKRDMGYRPSAAQDPFNAWATMVEIAGAPSGKLHNKKIAIKDNIAVAGVPMRNGSSILENYVPDVDATVVTRVLDAGGTILGKTQCEYYCLSGGSHTSHQGPVQNPHKRGHTSGGSSSGSAVVIATGEVDVALGCDQGGSIRTPSSYCGIVGLKPTWGLVPYTGIMPIELTLDHVGPMTRTVSDNALALEVIAGFDGLDPRQTALAEAQPYTQSLTKGAQSVRVGVLTEGFEFPVSDPAVNATVMSAAKAFERAGASVTKVSIPLHSLGASIWGVIALEGAARQMMLDNGHGFNWKGLYVTNMIGAHAKWRERANELPHTIRYLILAGQHYLRASGGQTYAKAQNVGRQLGAAYDAALKNVDVLLMPTNPTVAPLLPGPDASVEQYLQRAWENMENTKPFDVTGHPALQIPCGSKDDLPIGMMLVGRRFEESTLYQVAHAFEQQLD